MAKRRIAVFLNGPITSGKSSVAEILARDDADGCFIEGDEAVGMESVIDFTTWLERSIAEIGEAAVRFVSAGMTPYIAFPLRDADWSYLSARCKAAGATAVCVTLAPSMDVALSKRGKRALSPKETARIKEMYAEGYASRAFSALTLDNSNESAEATAKRIVGFLKGEPTLSR